MKRLIFILLTLAGWVCSAYAIIDNPAAIFSKGQVFVIPSSLSSDGRGYIYVEDDMNEETGAQHFSLYDDDFILTNDFTVQTPKLTYKEFCQQKEYVSTVKPGNLIPDENWNEDEAREITQEYPTAEELYSLLNDASYNLDLKIVTLEDGQEVVAFMFWMK